MERADRQWTRPEPGASRRPGERLEQEPPLKPQFEQAKASAKPLEPPQPDPAKVRADQRQAQRSRDFAGTTLAKAPVVTNAFDRANDNLRQPVRARPVPERPMARDHGLREAFKQVEARPAPQRAPEPVKQPAPERNWARGLNRPAQPPPTPQPKPEQAVKPEFNRASQGQAARDQAKEQSGSQMVRESQPKHQMQPPAEMRQEPDRQAYNERLAEEGKREAARQAAREADQRERDGRQDRQPSGPERSR